MDCRTYQKQLADLAAGTLPVRREAALRAHLEQCPACRAALASEQEFFRALDGTLRQELNPEIPAGLARRIRARVASESFPRRRWLPAWAVAAAFAALAVGVVLVQLKGHKAEPREPISLSVARESSPSENTIPSGDKSLLATIQQPAMKKRSRVDSTTVLKVREPQVQALVPPEQQKAVTRFLAGLQHGDVNGDILLADRRNLVLPLAEIAPLGLDPLGLKPLEIAQSDLH